MEVLPALFSAAVRIVMVPFIRGLCDIVIVASLDGTTALSLVVTGSARSPLVAQSTL